MAIDKQDAFLAEEDIAVELEQDPSIVNAKQGDDDSPPPNKDREFMERYQIEDNIMYTVFSAPSRYMKVITLSYMLQGGMPVSHRLQTSIAYIGLGVAIVLLKSSSGTYSSLLSVLVAAGMSALWTLTITATSSPNEDDEEEQPTQDDVGVSDDVYIGIDIPTKDKE